MDRFKIGNGLRLSVATTALRTRSTLVRPAAGRATFR